MMKISIGLLFGGASEEHIVSINSARAILQALQIGNNLCKYNVIPIYINDMPRWPCSFGLLFDCFASNFYFFWKIKKYIKLEEFILFEDFHSHPRLILCNFFVKILNRKIKIVTLMQLALFYHTVFKNRFF